jgi:hypothetical protein
MHIFRSAARMVALAAVALVISAPRAVMAQDAAAEAGTRTRIDLIPMVGYAHGGENSRHALVSAFRIGLRTETWGIAYTQEYWVAGWTCPRETDDVCDDPSSYTLGIDRRFAGSGGAALVAGADLGVMSWYGARAMGGVRVGLEQPIPPLGAIRIEGQAQKVLGIDVATVAALVGFRFSFGGPRLRHGAG